MVAGATGDMPEIISRFLNLIRIQAQQTSRTRCCVWPGRGPWLLSTRFVFETNHCFRFNGRFRVVMATALASELHCPSLSVLEAQLYEEGGMLAELLPLDSGEGIVGCVTQGDGVLAAVWLHFARVNAAFQNVRIPKGSSERIHAHAFEISIIIVIYSDVQNLCKAHSLDNNAKTTLALFSIFRHVLLKIVRCWRCVKTAEAISMFTFFCTAGHASQVLWGARSPLCAARWGTPNNSQRI